MVVPYTINYTTIFIRVYDLGYNDIVIRNVNQNKKPLVALFFAAFGIDAIISAGLLAAFTAHSPSQFYSWTTAYLVLVVGILQIGFSISLYVLAKVSSSKLIILAFILYNLGNFCVIFGTALKDVTDNHTLVVDLGGLLIVVTMLLFMFIARVAIKSWLKIFFYTLVGIILISVPIGLILAR